jgi:hypothetical protein
MDEDKMVKLEDSKEAFLLWILTQMPDQNARAVMLQSFIQSNGPLSEEAGAKVRELLAQHNG